MLRALILEVDGAVDAFTGKDVHGWFLKELVGRRAPELSAKLHDPARHRPFTIAAGYAARSGDPDEGAAGAPILRITSTAPPLSAMLDVVQPQHLGILRLGSASFSVSAVHRRRDAHPLTGCATMNELWQSASRARPGGRVRLRFLSPTAFKHDLTGSDGARERRNTLFPIPRLVFDSLARAWNSALQWSDPETAAAFAIPDAHKQELLRLVREEEYTLQSQPPIAFNRFSEKGFVGECVYSAGRHAPPEVTHALHLLARFSFYSGVGIRTQMGMGQTIYLPASPPNSPTS